MQGIWLVRHVTDLELNTRSSAYKEMAKHMVMEVEMTTYFLLLPSQSRVQHCKVWTKSCKVGKPGHDGSRMDTW